MDNNRKVPFVTAVIPTYNSVGMLGLTVQTVREQSLKNIEIIVVDDASTDRTQDIMKQFCKLDKRIRYFRNTKRKGAGYSRNRGNMEARAKYIMVCDAGDLNVVERAKFQYRFMKKHPEVDCCYSIVMHITALEKHTDTQEALLYKGEWGEKPSMSHPTAMYKRILALEMPYREDSINTDMFEDFFCRWGRAGKRFANLPALPCGS